MAIIPFALIWVVIDHDVLGVAVSAASFLGFCGLCVIPFRASLEVGIIVTTGTLILLISA